jgi:hypothetical protein
VARYVGVRVHDLRLRAVIKGLVSNFGQIGELDSFAVGEAASDTNGHSFHPKGVYVVRLQKCHVVPGDASIAAVGKASCRRV